MDYIYSVFFSGVEFTRGGNIVVFFVRAINRFRFFGIESFIFWEFFEFWVNLDVG